MNVRYAFPKQAGFGRVLPKSKIYDHASPSPKVKELFVREVEKIIWSYKLSPETINLPASGGVNEIQIFTVVLKTSVLNHMVLQAIDKAIPSPILFVLTFEGKNRYVATYKRQSEADKKKWVVSSYFETDWLSESTKTVDLPVVLGLGSLYQTLLRGIIPFPLRANETIDEFVTRIENLEIKKREAGKVEARLMKEKQFNRKVDYNAELRNLNNEIVKLKH